MEKIVGVKQTFKEGACVRYSTNSNADELYLFIFSALVMCVFTGQLSIFKVHDSIYMYH